MIKKYYVDDIKGHRIYEGFDEDYAYKICRQYNESCGGTYEVEEEEIRNDLPEDEFRDLKDNVCNDLLDLMCDIRGVKDTIKYLVESGLSIRELLALDFDEDDIINVLEERE